MKLFSKVCGNCSEFDIRRALFQFDWGTLGVAVVLTAIGFMAYRTVYPPPPPLYDESGHALAYRNKESTTVEYERRFKIRDTFNGKVYRTVECDGQRTFDVPAITRQFTAGTHHTVRTFSMDYKFLPDSDCVLRTWIEHQPFGSLRDHIYELEKVHFRVMRGKDD